MRYPWDRLVDGREGVWAGFAAWEQWLHGQLPEYASAGYDDTADRGAWKENLYAIVSDLVDKYEQRAEKAEAEVERLRECARIAIERLDRYEDQPDNDDLREIVNAAEAAGGPDG
jgi:hypothetical protein